jgi:hypothetical protein
LEVGSFGLEVPSLEIPNPEIPNSKCCLPAGWGKVIEEFETIVAKYFGIWNLSFWNF